MDVDTDLNWEQLQKQAWDKDLWRALKNPAGRATEPVKRLKVTSTAASTNVKTRVTFLPLTPGPSNVKKKHRNVNVRKDFYEKVLRKADEYVKCFLHSQNRPMEDGNIKGLQDETSENKSQKTQDETSKTPNLNPQKNQVEVSTLNESHTEVSENRKLESQKNPQTQVSYLKPQSKVCNEKHNRSLKRFQDNVSKGLKLKNIMYQKSKKVYSSRGLVRPESVKTWCPIRGSLFTDNKLCRPI